MSDNNEDWLDQLQGLRGEPARGKLDELPRDRSYERVIMRRLDDIEAQLEQLRWINKRTNQMAKQADNVDRFVRDARWLINGLVIGGLLSVAYFFTSSRFGDAARWVLYALAGGYFAFLIIRLA